MSENPPESNFSAKKSYQFVVIGLAMLIIGIIFAYSSNQHLNAGTLPDEELSRQVLIFAASKVVSMIGFIIALIPSVRILQDMATSKKSKAETEHHVKIEEHYEHKEKNEGDD